MEKVTLKLPGDLLRNAARVASGDNVTVGHLVRVLLAREVSRRLDGATDGGDTLLAAVKALLDRDCDAATGWEDLASRLQNHGYALRPSQADLTLYKLSCGSPICDLGALGHSRRDLETRFGGAMPAGTLTGRVMLSGRSDQAPVAEDRKARLLRDLAPVFEAATDWEALTDDLASRGFELRAHGRGLALYSRGRGRHICNTAAFGFRYRALVARIGTPMPGHPFAPGRGDTKRSVAANDIELIERE